MMATIQLSTLTTMITILRLASAGGTTIHKQLVCGKDELRCPVKSSELRITSVEFRLASLSTCKQRKSSCEKNSTHHNGNWCRQGCRVDVDDILTYVGCQPSLQVLITYVCEASFEMNNTTAITPTQTTETMHDSWVFIVFKVLNQFFEVKTYMQAHPQKFLICLVLSVSAAFALLIIYIVTSLLFNKCCKQHNKFDVEDSAESKPMVVSAPIVHTAVPAKYNTIVIQRGGSATSQIQRQQSVASSLRSESVETVNITTLPRHTDYQVISTIRRSHSIDEGTQTDKVATPDDTQRSMSVQEEVELDNLVDVMNYYNSRLDHDFDPPIRETCLATFGSKDDDEVFPLTEKNFANNKPSLPARYNSIDRSSNNQSTFKSSPPKTTFPTSPSRTQERYKSVGKAPPVGLYGRSNSTGVGSVGTNTLPQRSFSTGPAHQYSKQSSKGASVTTDENLFSPDSIFNGDTLRHSPTRRKMKLGVRGDGFSYIGSQ